MQDSLNIEALDIEQAPDSNLDQAYESYYPSTNNPTEKEADNVKETHFTEIQLFDVLYSGVNTSVFHAEETFGHILLDTGWCKVCVWQCMVSRFY